MLVAENPSGWSHADGRRQAAGRSRPLLAMPAPQPADMCSECQAPADWHTYALSLRLWPGTPEPGSTAAKIAVLLPAGGSDAPRAPTTRPATNGAAPAALPGFDASQWQAMLTPVLRAIFAPAHRQQRKQPDQRAALRQRLRNAEAQAERLRGQLAALERDGSGHTHNRAAADAKLAYPTSVYITNPGIHLDVPRMVHDRRDITPGQVNRRWVRSLETLGVSRTRVRHRPAPGGPGDRAATSECGETQPLLNHYSTTNSRKQPDPAGRHRTRTRSTLTTTMLVRGCFHRWWQVMGSNHRRLSRRFYRPPRLMAAQPL